RRRGVQRQGVPDGDHQDGEVPRVDRRRHADHHARPGLVGGPQLPPARPRGHRVRRRTSVSSLLDVTEAAGGGFRVTLENFSGPFDLLLQLIGKHKLDVTEVALHQVTDEFIAYIRAMGDDWDLDEASEFLVVAATLLDLKAARLLPAAVVEDEEDLALLEARDLRFHAGGRRPVPRAAGAVPRGADRLRAGAGAGGADRTLDGPRRPGRRSARRRVRRRTGGGGHVVRPPGSRPARSLFPDRICEWDCTH